MSFIPTEYSDPIFVYSLRNVFPRYGGPLVRVIRESDHIEGDVYPDDNGEVSYDSTIIVNPSETSALVLGEFLNIDGYTDADGLGEVYEGRLSKIYDQSAGAFDVGVNIYNVSFLFVETNLPAYGGSTAIHKVNGVPAFFATATQPMFKLAQARGREVSYHFMTEGVGTTQYFGFVGGGNTYGIWGLHDIEAEITSATLFPTQQWDINAIYFDSELGDNSFVSNVYSSETFNNFDSVITTVEAQLLDTATTQAAFPDNEVTFNVMSYNWYCDIVAFDGYDPIRRITIEQLYAQSASNTTAFARTSSLLINNENPNQSGFLAQFPNAAAAYSVRSLTGNTGTDGPKVVRVRRDSDNVEVDVYTDTTGFITLDSPIANTTEYTDATVNAPFDTSCTVLGQFVNNDEYDDIDNLGSPDTATVVAWYDQSATDAVSPLPTGAAAAYSVRKLFDTYDGNALNIRRDSDDATQDIGFNGDGDLDVQAIEDFVREGVVGANYPSDLLLDIIPENEQSAPEAAAAYSLRRLREAYDGPLIRVRRDSDHAEADVYAYKLVDGLPEAMDFIGLDSFVTDATEITDSNPDVPSDESTLRDFARGANLTVVVWYDQAHAYDSDWYTNSIGQNNAVQEVSGSQPKIYDEFTGLITENGKPASIYDGSASQLTASISINSATASTGFVVFNADAVTPNKRIYNMHDGATGDERNHSLVNSQFNIFDGTNGLSVGAAVTGTQYVTTTRFVTGDGTIHANGTLQGTSAAIAQKSINTLSIGKQDVSSAFYFDGKIQELIIYPSDQDTNGNRENIEKNINNAYEIYGGWRATVETWYDQSSNNNHATQADTLSQPTIYDNGGVVMENGKAAIKGDGSTTSLRNFNVALSSDYFISLVSKLNSAGTNMWLGTTSVGGYFRAVDAGTSVTIRHDGETGGGDFNVSVGTNQLIHTSQRVGTTMHYAQNGSNNTATERATQGASFSVTCLFDGYTNSYEIDGTMQEVILYNSNKSDNRPTIEKNINSYYNIYIDNAATQQVAGSQPTLVSSGELVKENGKAALHSVYDNLSTGLVVDTSAVTFVMIGRHLSGNDGWFFGSTPSGSSFTGFGIQCKSSGSFRTYYGDGSIFNIQEVGAPASLSQYLLFQGKDTTGWETSVNSSVYKQPTVQDRSTTGTLYLRGQDDYFHEFIVYDSNQTENRFDLESNINSAFQVYSAGFPSALDTVPEAKAAYSVRRLTKEYTGPIITVDNGTTTKDFYADFWGNLDKTALTEFANSNTLSITKWWDQSGRGEHLVATGESKPILDPATLNITVNDTNKFNDDPIITDINNSYDPDNEIYLLDEYSGAAAAYSLRKIRSGYDGPLVRVRKDGDNNAEVDVYPDANGTISTSSPVTDVTEITDTNPSVVSSETTFGDFMSGYDGKVVVWYDQSADFTADWYTNPNSQNNAVQDVSGSQPKVYDSVTGVELDNTKAALTMSGSQFLRANASLTTEDVTLFTVYSADASKATQEIAGIGERDASKMRANIVLTDKHTTSIYNNNLLYNTNAGTQVLHTSVYDYPSTIEGAINGGTFNTKAVTMLQPSSPIIYVGESSTVSTATTMLGKAQEIIIYPSDQSDNRLDIERDINRHYQMYDQTNRVVAVHNGDVQRTVDLNQESYTDLKEIIHYQ